MAPKAASTFLALLSTAQAFRAHQEGSLAIMANVSNTVSRVPTAEERDSFVNTHNLYRCMHGSNPVVWDDDMAKAASTYVESMGRTMKHSNSYKLNPPQGENLFWASVKATPEVALAGWYDEVNKCQGGPEGFTDGCATASEPTGHFTALIWKGVEAIGCAINDGPGYRTMICRYRGPKEGGHFTDTPNTNKRRGEYVKHVFPRTKTKEECSSSTGQASSAPAPSPPSSGSKKGEKDAKGRVPSGDERAEFVKSHNIYRCMHGSNKVIWDESMAESASEFVGTLTNTMTHSNSYQLEPPQGENMYMSTRAVTPEETVASWYNEVDDCKGGPVGFVDGCANPEAGKVTGHFTAMIWSGAEAVGCAIKDEAPKIVICRYRGPKDGPLVDTPNWNKASGEYKKHVFPRRKSLETCTAEVNGSGHTRGSLPLVALALVAFSSLIFN